MGEEEWVTSGGVEERGIAATTTRGGWPEGVAVASPWKRLGSWFLEELLILVTLGIGWLIWGALVGSVGQTPAKQLLKLRVVRLSNQRPVGLGTMFWVRGLLAGFVAYFAIVFTVGVLLFMPFWDRRNQNIWDKVSGTVVVDDPDDAWGLQSPAVPRQ